MPLKLVLRLVDPAPKLADLILQRVDARQKLGDEFVAAILLLWRRRVGRWTDGGPSAARRLVLDRPQLLTELIDLVLQRDAFPAVHLGLCGHHGGCQQKACHDDRSNGESHANFLGGY